VTAAVTDPARLAAAGCGLSQGVPEAVRRAAVIHRAAARSGASADHFRQVASQPGGSGSAAVGGPPSGRRFGHPGDGTVNHENQAGRHLSPRAAAEEKPQAVEVPTPVASSAEAAALRALLGHAATAPDQAGESGWQAVALAAVEALDGSERKLLLARLADSEPEAVVAALVWLEQWHAGSAERRRADRSRKAKDRRRRQRRDGARAG
jgi:hypothetical protein